MSPMFGVEHALSLCVVFSLVDFSQLEKLVLQQLVGSHWLETASSEFRRTQRNAFMYNWIYHAYILLHMMLSVIRILHTGSTCFPRSGKQYSVVE
jgi:hypothetical protein